MTHFKRLFKKKHQLQNHAKYKKKILQNTHITITQYYLCDFQSIHTEAVTHNAMIETNVHSLCPLSVHLFHHAVSAGAEDTTQVSVFS